MIERGRGNLLTANVDALVNTVNTQGIMGKGLALQFKKAFPTEFGLYEQACKAGRVTIGCIHVIERLTSPRFIFNFPTKKHWRQPSRLSYISEGLIDLTAQVRSRGIASIAIPPLGCGNGGLHWSEVRPLIVESMNSMPEVRVLLYEPDGAPAAADLLDRRPKLAMTAGRAAIVALMDRYLATQYGYRLSLVEVQKLAYFLQEAGQPLRLDFRAHYFGPYADNLQKALRNMEGHYTVGLGDGNASPETPLELLPNVVEAAYRFLSEDSEVKNRIQRVASLIEGFETPLGMELLGTVHWVLRHGADPADPEAVVAKVHSWSPRKRSQMKEHQIRQAWKRLRDQGWAGSAGEETAFGSTKTAES